MVSCVVVSTHSLFAADVVSVVMNRKVFVVCRHVFFLAWETKVLVVSLDTDLCV